MQGLVARHGVVVHDVEDYSDSGLMRGLHHVSEFKMLLIFVTTARIRPHCSAEAFERRLYPAGQATV
jgi:hypothetical protein